VQVPASADPRSTGADGFAAAAEAAAAATLAEAAGAAEAAGVAEVDYLAEADAVLLVDLVTAAVRRHGGGWQLGAAGGVWRTAEPPGYRPREQGWKLHVSATPVSAPLVLARVADVLVRARCAFKFAASLIAVYQLGAPDQDRGGSGKFVTAYPDDDDQFRLLAAELHRATENLPGPAVLSDRRYRPGSLVHYRYGVFTGVTLLGNDGSYQARLRAPDGELVADQRLPWFAPPAWARSPLPELSGPGDAATVPGPVLLDDRFEVRAAIQHGNRGGVFRATDRCGGADVVIKQARAHAAALLDGTDARDLLRHEAEVLELLAPAGIAPRPVRLFSQQGDLFLAEEEVPGVPLRAWVYDRIHRELDASGGPVAALPVAEVAELAGRTLDLLGAVHAAGLVLRDLSPGNVLVGPDRVLRLVDLEHAARPGDRVARVGTPGFIAPEQWSAGFLAPATGPAGDLYALGCLVFYLACGTEPGTPAGPDPDRVARLVRMVAVGSPTMRAVAPLVLGLCRAAPAARWTAARAAAFLRALARPVTPAGAAAAAGRGDRLAPAEQDRLIGDAVAYLLATMRPDHAERLWAAAPTDTDSDPCNVQYGAAGTLAVLTRAATLPPRAGTGGLFAGGLFAGVEAAAGWLDRRLPVEPRLLPGLYFGRSGAGWALFEAARLLGDERMAARAVELTSRLPARWPNPDVCHGTAGAGLAGLALWTATGDERLARLVRDCADQLVAAVQHRSGEVCWPVPADFDSTLAGLTHYGFAHGVAGIGTFLLAAGQATGEARYLELACAAGATLRRVAHRPGDAAWWPVGEEADPGRPIRMPHWCSGSSGVGTFLLRLWRYTGDPDHRELAEAAAVAVRALRWQVSPVACHGLAGDGQFLLDLAQALDQPRYHRWAAELAGCLHAYAVERDGRLVMPGEDRSGVHAGYNTGLAGALDFLLRLRHGGPRPWLVDPPAAPGHRSGLLAECRTGAR